MKILVTGAAGFIGFHTVRELIAQNHVVVGIDNLNDYYDPLLKTARLKQLGVHMDQQEKKPVYESGPFTFYRADINDREAVTAIFDKHNFETVIHLAAQGGTRYSLLDPDSYIKININGFFNILECVKKAKPLHFIFASSSSVYGNNKVPFEVTDNTDTPVSLYAATKKSNELLAYCYSKLHNIRTTGLRFFTVYGPWGRPDMAYFSFTNALMEGKEIPLYNNGELYRDFTYIDDIVKGILAVTEKNNTGDSFKIYNIGNHKSVQLLDFVKLLEELSGKKARLNLVPMQPGDVYATCADISEIQKDYGFIPSTGLKEGITKFMDWYRGYFNN